MQTASQILEEIERIHIMANPDQLRTIQAVIPYIQHRQVVAMDYLKNPDPSKMELINQLNQNIIKVLSIQ